MPVHRRRKPLPTDAEIELRTWKRRRPFAGVGIVILLLVLSFAPPFTYAWSNIDLWRHQLLYEEEVNVTLVKIGMAQRYFKRRGVTIPVTYTVTNSAGASSSLIQQRHQGRRFCQKVPRRLVCQPLPLLAKPRRSLGIL